MTTGLAQIRKTFYAKVTGSVADFYHGRYVQASEDMLERGTGCLEVLLWDRRLILTYNSQQMTLQPLAPDEAARVSYAVYSRDRSAYAQIYATGRDLAKAVEELENRVKQAAGQYLPVGAYRTCDDLVNAIEIAAIKRRHNCTEEEKLRVQIAWDSAFQLAMLLDDDEAAILR